jgi:hypothetical protein
MDADDFAANSINHTDILDDVGIASAASSSFNLLATGYTAYLTREITIPAAGYILAIATADVYLDHGISGSTSAILAISDQPNDLDGSRAYETYLLYNVGAGSYGLSASCQQLLHPTSAGTYTYYLIGKRSADNDAYIGKRALDLLYIRTVYASKDGSEDTDMPTDTPESESDLRVADAESEIVPTDSDNIEQLRRDMISLQNVVAELKSRLDQSGE